MKFFNIKQHFYKYINKEEYVMAISIVFGAIFSVLMSSYSSYLTDKNNRIDMLNKKPLNHIWIDCITPEEYEFMIDKKNWKPSSLRKKQEYKPKKNQEKLIDNLNKWLVNQRKKQIKEYEVEPESLKKLAELNKTTYTINKDEMQNDEYIATETSSNNNNVKNKINILPPDRKKKVEEKQYFVIQEAGSNARNNPMEFKKNNKKQNVKISTTNKKIGKIADKDIRKDRSIFESLIKIWRAALYRKEAKKGQVIHTGYDRYGNKIFYEKNYKNNNKTENTVQQIKNEDTTSSFVFLNPVLIIDGNIQNAQNSVFNKNAIENNLNADEIKILTYLEYNFEKCWYKKNKNNNSLREINISVFYNQDKNISDIKINSINGNKNTEKQKVFVKNVIDIITSCKISNITDLTSKNYNLWGKMNIILINN